ncbi:MAG: hypothetical protein EHM89_09955, partial [Acidobacteria bacterium]
MLQRTLTGVDPTTADSAIASGGSILVDRTATLKARACKTGRPPSRVASANYTLAPRAPTIVATRKVIHGTRRRDAVHDDDRRDDRYTTTGEDPGESSPACSEAVGRDRQRG